VRELRVSFGRVRTGEIATSSVAFGIRANRLRMLVDVPRRREAASGWLGAMIGG